MAETSQWLVDVVVMPKEGVNDPEGESILGGLKGLGYDGVRRVRAGKRYQVQIEAASEQDASKAAESMARKLLSNPVIQSFDIDQISPIDASTGESE